MNRKQTIFTLFLAALTCSGYTQGAFVALDNNSNTSTDPAATASGLFWISTGGPPVLIQQDFNAAFYGGTDSTSLTLIRSFTGAAIIGDNGSGPGKFTDPTGNQYPVQGTTTASTSAFFQIQAWTGNFNSYAEAVTAGAPAAQSPIFVNQFNNPLGPPADFVGMPAMVLSIPEPSTFALVGLGGLLALIFWQCKRIICESVPG